jgi:hypothetical protein
MRAWFHQRRSNFGRGVPRTAATKMEGTPNPGAVFRSPWPTKATFCDAHHIASATDTLEPQIG